MGRPDDPVVLERHLVEELREYLVRRAHAGDKDAGDMAHSLVVQAARSDLARDLERGDSAPRAVLPERPPAAPHIVQAASGRGGE